MGAWMDVAKLFKRDNLAKKFSELYPCKIHLSFDHHTTLISLMQKL